MDVVRKLTFTRRGKTRGGGVYTQTMRSGFPNLMFGVPAFLHPDWLWVQELAQVHRHLQRQPQVNGKHLETEGFLE